jgi:hypothetical protein
MAGGRRDPQTGPGGGAAVARARWTKSERPEGHESPITVTAIVRRRGLMSHSR